MLNLLASPFAGLTATALSAGIVLAEQSTNMTSGYAQLTLLLGAIGTLIGVLVTGLASVTKFLEYLDRRRGKTIEISVAEYDRLKARKR